MLALDRGYKDMVIDFRASKGWDVSSNTKKDRRKPNLFCTKKSLTIMFCGLWVLSKTLIWGVQAGAIFFLPSFFFLHWTSSYFTLQVERKAAPIPQSRRKHFLHHDWWSRKRWEHLTSQWNSQVRKWCRHGYNLRTVMQAGMKEKLHVEGNIFLMQTGKSREQKMLSNVAPNIKCWRYNREDEKS